MLWQVLKTGQMNYSLHRCMRLDRFTILLWQLSKRRITARFGVDLSCITAFSGWAFPCSVKRKRTPSLCQADDNLSVWECGLWSLCCPSACRIANRVQNYCVFSGCDIGHWGLMLPRRSHISSGVSECLAGWKNRYSFAHGNSSVTIKTSVYESK